VGGGERGGAKMTSKENKIKKWKRIKNRKKCGLPFSIE